MHSLHDCLQEVFVANFGTQSSTVFRCSCRVTRMHSRDAALPKHATNTANKFPRLLAVIVCMTEDRRLGDDMFPG